MTTKINLGDISVDVVFKDIKNVHLSVYPPAGRVRIAAPSRMSLDTLRVYAISRLGWIKRQQKKLLEQERETPRDYLDRESHFVWGKRYLLKVVEADAAPEVVLRHSQMLLRMRPGSSKEKRNAALEEWYRGQLKAVASPLIAKWAPHLGVEVDRFFVQRMKTKWGSCNPERSSIRLNSELAKKPPQCLEYIVVHELVHLLERHHDERFTALMDRVLPNWRSSRDSLNRSPLGHESWAY